MRNSICSLALLIFFSTQAFADRGLFQSVDCNVLESRASSGSRPSLSPAQTLTHQDSIDTKVTLPYSIHLMWINKEWSDSKFVFPFDRGQEFIKQIKLWKRLNPEANLIFWYDGAFVKNGSVEVTLKCFDSGEITMRDVRELEIVKSNPDVFSEKINVYFRADLLRIIVAYTELSVPQASWFVYADIDIAPIAKEIMFDNSTQKHLDQYGFELVEWSSGFENSFQIFGNSKPSVIEAIKFAIIDLNLSKIKNLLAGNFYVKSLGKSISLLKITDENERRRVERFISQMVYESYAGMFMYFFQLENLALLTFQDEKSKSVKEYSRDAHGLSPFGDRTLRLEFFPFKLSPLPGREALDLDEYGFLPIPLKKMRIPSSQGVWI
jgi:hypothetical protein